MASSRWTLVAMSLGFAVVQLDVSVVNVAIRAVGDDLGGGIPALQWIVNAYTVAFAAFILSAGALGDRVGARRVFVGGFVLFAGASAACGLAHGVGPLIAARAAQGVGAAVLVPCSLILLNHSFDEPGRAIGWWAAGGATALSAGPLVGGTLIAAFGWRTIFFINLPIGLFAIWLTLRFTSETPRSPGRIDLPGQTLAVAGLAVLAAGIIARSWMLLLGLLLLVAFVFVEARSARPMLPLRLFGSRTFSSASAIGLALNAAIYGLLFALSLFFQREQGLSPLATGLAFLPMTAVVMAANVWAGTRSGKTIAVGGLLGAAAAAVLLRAGPDTSYWAMIGPLVVIGASVGLVVPVMTTSLMASVERARSGVASGTLNTLRQTGSAVGVAIDGSIGLHSSLAVAVGLLLAIAGLSRGIGEPLDGGG